MSHLATAVLRIASGATTSQALSDIWGANPAKVGLENCRAISITSPAALTGTPTVQVSPKPAGAPAWSVLRDGGSDVTLVAGKTEVLPREAGFKDLRIVSGSAEGADRDFYVQLMEALI